MDFMPNCLTCIIVEEPVLLPKHLGWFHDDGIRKLISHCYLSYSLENNIAWRSKRLEIHTTERLIDWKGNCAVCGETALYLIPQVFGWAAYISIEVGHVDKLCDASLSGCFGNLLRDGHEDIVVAKVPFAQKEENILWGELPVSNQMPLEMFLPHTLSPTLCLPGWWQHLNALKPVWWSLCSWHPTPAVRKKEPTCLVWMQGYKYVTCRLKTSSSMSAATFLQGVCMHLTMKMICPRSPMGLKYMMSYWSQRWGMMTWEPIRPIKHKDIQEEMWRWWKQLYVDGLGTIIATNCSLISQILFPSNISSCPF